MKIGNSIQVGGATYSINFKKDLKTYDNSPTYGYVDIATLEIFLDPQFGDETTEIALHHELEHIKDYHLGYIEDERVKLTEQYTVQRQYLQKQIVDQIIEWQK